jgi:hypothetical protein
MVFDRNAKGHAFDFSRGVCVKCGMNREHYQDNGQPQCTGRMPDPKIRVPVEEE